MNLSDFLLDRATAHVTRWHHRPTLMNESIAEHHALTARIAYFVATLVRHHNLADVDPCRVACAALFHDEPEILTGDVPGNMKRESSTLRESVRGLEAAACRTLVGTAPASLRSEYSFRLNGNGLGDVGLQIVKYADDCAALAFLVDEQRMGNVQITVRGTRISIQQAMAQLDWPWLVKLRDLEQGLP